MSRVHFRPSRAVLVVVAVAGLVVAALGAGASAASKPKSTAKADPSAVLRVGAGLDSNGGAAFDPANLTANASNAVWMELVYGNMIYTNPDGSSSPGLATEWSTPDPKTVNLTLRKATFSDGTPFDSAAVKQAWDRTLQSGSSFLNADHKAIESVEAPDPQHIVVHLNAPLADKMINDTLRNPYFMAVPSPSAIAAGDINQKPIGAGPYVLESRDGNQRLVMKKNPRYYDAKSAKLAGVEFTNVANGITQVNALMSDAIDLTWGLPQESISALSSNPDLEVLYFPGASTSMMQLCTSQGIFASKEARQAIQYAIDRMAINEAAFDGGADEVQTALPPSHPFFEKKLNSTYEYNPKKARALLKKAGVAPGTKVTALVAVAPAFQTAAEVVQANLKDVGLEMEITPTQNILTDSPRLKPDIGFLSVQPQYLSLAYVLPETAINACSWSNPEASAALTTATDSSQPPAQVKEAWHTFQTIALEESPKVLYATAPYNVVTRTDVAGVDYYMPSLGPSLVKAYMTEQS